MAPLSAEDAREAEIAAYYKGLGYPRLKPKVRRLGLALAAVKSFAADKDNSGSGVASKAKLGAPRRHFP